ncbi:MAG: HD domain-containing protein [Patescibacteria group bacterium]|nr:HD domain-containing protein [Patescibacteria group bacterium]
MHDNLMKFISEIYMLKRNRREGFRLSGVEHPDSLADHVTITAQLAFIIGELEGLDGKDCAAVVLFHDNGETRTTDQHKVAARYVERHDGEWRALQEQLSGLPDPIRNKIKGLVSQIEERSTPEGIVAKDADWIEAAIQAKIYSEQGYQLLDSWIENVTNAVETKTAKAIMEKIKATRDFTTCWWQGLKKVTYKKM